MGLLSYFKRKSEPSADAHSASAAEPDAVAAARTRARRRLIGATVLLGIGVIGFPLLFETQPRPVPINIPIEIPSKDGATPLLLPPAAPLSAASAAVLDEAPVGAQGRPDPVAAAEIVERAAEQGRDVPGRAAVVPATAAVVRPSPPAATEPAPAKAAAAAAVVAPAAAVAKPPAAAATKPDDGARARALLNGNSNSNSSSSSSSSDTPAAASVPAARLVVQVGAYADAAKLAEARKKLEALGIKTYTQVVEVGGAKRTRVRVGPFASRADADKVAARVKSAGLPVAILTL
jgi:DedD protein